MSPQNPKLSGPPEEVPFMQKVLDNPWLLVILGVVTPTLFYHAWGVIEVVMIPLAR